ncbi:MAG: DUF2029 domain-containing protein [Sphingobacteriales bacterium]|nr:MAG: DUF2029 domain-containing protein [Sphingobacteriales bacterium]
MLQYAVKKNWIYLPLSIVILGFYVANATMHQGCSYDINCWFEWSWYGKENGIQNIYTSSTNYFPLYLYLLTGFASFFDSVEQLGAYIYILRLITLIFDILGVYFIYLFLEKRYSFWKLLVFAFINISFLYNSLIWGQVDAILGFLVFASIYYLHKQNIVLAALFLALSLTFKLQAIIFLPVFGLYLLYKTPLRQWLSKVSIAVIIFIASLLLICFPFIIEPERFLIFKSAVTGLVGYYPVVTMGAANMWSIFLSDHADKILDNTALLAAITYKQTGLALFCISSFFALLPLLKAIIRKIKANMGNVFSVDKLMLTASLVGLNFYFFNTQIHERYSHPVFLFLMCYSFLRKDYFPFILFSIAYFLNLESLLRWGQFDNYHTVIFERYFAGALYAIVLIYLFFRLYQKKHIQQTDQS